MKWHYLYTPEKAERVNKTTKAVVKDYLSECKAAGLTVETVKGYTDRLRYSEMLILDYFDNKSILEMTRSDFRDLLLLLQFDFELSNSTVNGILSVLTNCLNYVVDNEDTWNDYLKSPLTRMKRLPKIGVREKVFISREEVRKLINKLVANWRLQDAVMISLLYDSGARIAELAQVKKKDILKGNVTNEVIRKGQKKKVKLVFMNDTKALIEKWLEQREGDNIEELFIYPSLPTRSNKHLKRAIDKHTLADRIKRAGDMLGKHISPHVFRRSRAEGLKRGEDERFGNRKFDPREIQVLLGHTDLATTQIYLKDDTKEVMENILKMMED